MDILEIITHCKAENQVAQDILFNMYYRQMYHLSMRILANHHDVEDVLIVSFVKVFNNIQRFEYRGNDSLKKWIKTIVINESIRFVNARNRISYDNNLTEFDNTMDHDTEFDLIDTEKIYSIIENMPVGYRLVFNLFAIEGYSHKEISAMLNIAENTSKSQLRKARIYIIEKINKTENNEYSGY